MKRDKQQDKVVRNILDNLTRYALYGMSGNPVRPSYFVGTYLSGNGFDFVSINPRLQELFGRPCFAKLQDVTRPPEVVVVFRRAEETPQIAKEAIQIGAKALWLQYGIQYPQTRKIAEEAGLLYVENRCIKVEHARLYGKMHQAGLNTGVISSRKRAVKTR